MKEVNWSKMTEEQKYAEWSEGYEASNGQFLSYEGYCGLWDSAEKVLGNES